MNTNFRLRSWRMTDLNSLVKYANNPHVSENMAGTFPFPYREEDGRAFIKFANEDNPVHVFAIDVEGVAIGAIGVHPQEDIYQKNAELGYWLAEPFWNKGIISEAVKRAVDFAFSTYDITRLYAKSFGANKASQKILQKNNFILEGRFRRSLFKNNQYDDEFIYALHREDWEKRKRKEKPWV